MGEPPASVTDEEMASKKVRDKSWHYYISEDLPRTVVESTDSAIRSARSLQHSSSARLRNLRVRPCYFFLLFSLALDFCFCFALKRYDPFLSFAQIFGQLVQIQLKKLIVFALMFVVSFLLVSYILLFL